MGWRWRRRKGEGAEQGGGGIQEQSALQQNALVVVVVVVDEEAGLLTAQPAALSADLRCPVTRAHPSWAPAMCVSEPVQSRCTPGSSAFEQRQAEGLRSNALQQSCTPPRTNPSAEAPARATAQSSICA